MGSTTRIRFPTGSGNFSFRHRIQTDSGAHPASYPVGTGCSFPEVKRPGCEVDHSPPSSAEVKNGWRCTSTPPHVCVAWSLLKHRENSAFASSTLICFRCRLSESRDSSVGIALGYGLDDRGSRVRFPAEAGNFSLHHRVQTGSGAHPASCPVGVRGSFPGVKRQGCETDLSPPSSAEVKNAWSYTSTSPIRLHGVVLS
jgi:hypothetical protein